MMIYIYIYTIDTFRAKWLKAGINAGPKFRPSAWAKLKNLRLTPPPHNGVGKEEDSLISTQMINVKVCLGYVVLVGIWQQNIIVFFLKVFEDENISFTSSICHFSIFRFDTHFGKMY